LSDYKLGTELSLLSEKQIQNLNEAVILITNRLQKKRKVFRTLHASL